MGKVKVSEMQQVTSLSNLDSLMVLQESQNKRATVSQLFNAANIRTVIVDIPSASVLQLHLTNYELIAAPGAGKYIYLLPYGLFQLVFNTVAYVRVNSAVLQFYYGFDRTISRGITAIGGFGDDTENTITNFAEPSGGGVSSISLSSITNKALTIRTTSDTAFYTTGNGVFRVIINYMIIDI